MESQVTEFLLVNLLLQSLHSLFEIDEIWNHISVCMRFDLRLALANENSLNTKYRKLQFFQKNFDKHHIPQPQQLLISISSD